jgi:hypothetical protein
MRTGYSLRMVTEERVVNLETALATFIDQSNMVVAAIHEDIAEIRASNARTDRQLLAIQQKAERDREEGDKDRRRFNKQLAEISESMGTLVEDMVAPCGFQLAKTIFITEEAQTCSIRVKRRHPAQSGEMMELDLLAIGTAKVLAVDVKRRMDAAKADEYRRKLQRLPEFFPELAGKTVCAAVASVYLEPSVVAFLSSEKLYGIAMGNEVMEVVNLGQF